MIPSISNFAKVASLFLLFTLNIRAQAQSNDQDWRNETQVAILFGLTQPLIASGFNIEGNLIYKRLIFDYSHGASLDFTDDLLTTELQEQGVVVHVPWTTGFGVGYRFTHWLNLRVEPKWHRFEFYYDGDEQNNTNRITAYTTFTLGAGLYAFLQPFRTNTGFLKGITIAPSIRYWPTVSSTLEGDTFRYTNKNTGAVEEIETLDPGAGFTPLVFNISVGYSFRIKKEK
jgi:hypothetical protein